VNGDRRGAGHAGRLSIAGAMALIATLAPPRGTALALVGASSPLLDRVAAGVWCFKALLLFHAALLIALPRLVRLERAPGAQVSPAAPTDPRDGVWDRLLVGLVIVALAIRLVRLGEGLWFDEIRTLVEHVRLSWGRLIVTFDTQNQHFLYSLAAKAAGWLPIGGAAALRLPAVLFGTASVAALYLFGRLVADRREAFLGAAALTFSYHHVWFSQNARGYTGVLLWTLVATWAFARILRGDARGWRLPLLYALASALAIYTHLTAAVMVVGHGIVFAIRDVASRRTAGRRGVTDGGPASAAPLVGLLLATTFSLQLYALVLPQLPTMLAGEPSSAAIAWKSPLWLVAETARGLVGGVPGGALVLIPAALVGALGLVSYWRRDPAVVGLMVVPGLLTAIAIVVMRHNLWPRFFFPSAGFAVLIGVRGAFEAVRLARLPKAPRLATAALAVAIAGSALTVPRAWGPKQDHEAAAEYVDRLLQPGDAVVVIDMTPLPLVEYLGRPYRTIATIDDLLEVEREHDRIWLLYSFPTRLAAEFPEIWRRLQDEYREVASFPGTVRGGAVVLMRRG